MARWYGAAAMLVIFIVQIFFPLLMGFGKAGFGASGWVFGCLFMTVYHSFVAPRP